jgi:hypothetical protein
VIDRGQVHKRKKKPSKQFRDTFGHTPVVHGSSRSGGAGAYPAQESTGNLGYFGNRGSTADSAQKIEHQSPIRAYYAHVPASRTQPDHRNRRGLLHLNYAALYVSAWNLPPVT